MEDIKNNFYDNGMIILVSTLAMGQLGGAFQLTRIIGLLFLPYVIYHLFINKYNVSLSRTILFFGIWITYMVITLYWTPEFTNGIKEIIYLIINFTIFILLVQFSEKANKPILSILKGWTLILVFTLPIALYEISTFQHLPISRDTDFFMNIGEKSVKHRYASATFYNYNTYVVMLNYCIPYCLVLISILKKRLYKIFCWGLIISAVIILFINASRGGIICLGIITLTYIFYLKRKMIFKFKNIIPITISICVIGFFIIRYSQLIFSQLIHRIEQIKSIEALIDGNARLHLYKIALILTKKSNYLGTGAGSEKIAMESMSTNITATHNIFLEVMLEYGLIIFILFCIFLFSIFKKYRFINVKDLRFIILVFLLIALPLFIINSGYLLFPATWVLFSSLYIIGNRKNYNTIL